MSLPCEPFIIGNYITYKRLAELNLSVFGKEDYEKFNGVIDIYLDLYSILKGLFGENYDPCLDKTPYAIAAAILNMIAHYRAFYRSQNIETRMFIVFGSDMNPDKDILVPKYKHELDNALMSNRNYIFENLKIVELVSKYINNTAVLFSENADSATLIYSIVARDNPDYSNYSIIITKDIVSYQLCCIVPKMVIFRPKKYKGQDVSFFVSQGGVYYALHDEWKIKSNINCNGISSGLYSFVLAATKVPSRGLRSLYTLPAMMVYLQNVCSSPDVLNGYNLDIDYFCEHFPTDVNMKLQHNNIKGRFKVIDTIVGYNRYSVGPEYLLYKGIQNLYDPNGLHEIDQKFFEEYHLDFERM